MHVTVNCRYTKITLLYGYLIKRPSDGEGNTPTLPSESIINILANITGQEQVNNVSSSAAEETETNKPIPCPSAEKHSPSSKHGEKRSHQLFNKINLVNTVCRTWVCVWVTSTACSLTGGSGWSVEAEPNVLLQSMREETKSKAQRNVILLSLIWHLHRPIPGLNY